LQKQVELFSCSTFLPVDRLWRCTAVVVSGLHGENECMAFIGLFVYISHDS